MIYTAHSAIAHCCHKWIYGLTRPVQERTLQLPCCSLIPRQTDKPVLADALWNEVKLEQISQPSQQLYVLEGGALLYRIPWKHSITFCDICSCYVHHRKQTEQTFHQYTEWEVKWGGVWHHAAGTMLLPILGVADWWQVKCDFRQCAKNKSLPTPPTNIG